jgi:integrase
MNQKHPQRTALRDVSKDIAEEYAATLNHGSFAANTYNKHLNLLTMVFRVLKHKAKLTENPWGEIPRKRVINRSRRELTVEELKKVCQNTTGELRTLFALGIYTGLRQGDCCTLRRGEVDLHRAVIRRVPNKTARRNPKPVLIPIHPVLRTMLEEIPAEEREDYVLPAIAEEYGCRFHGSSISSRSFVQRRQQPAPPCGHKPDVVSVFWQKCSQARLQSLPRRNLMRAPSLQLYGRESS